MTHLQTIHTNLLVYVVQIPIKYLRLMVLITFMIFARAIDMYELQTKTILDNRYKFVKKIAVFIPLSLYWITMIYDKYMLFVLFNSFKHLRFFFQIDR